MTTAENLPSAGESSPGTDTLRNFRGDVGIGDSDIGESEANDSVEGVLCLLVVAL